MKEKEQEVWVADAETDPFQYGAEIKPFLWGIYNGSKTLLFDSTSEFTTFIRSIRDKNIIYAHNGGKFDWHFIFDDVEPETDILIINGRIAKLPLYNAELRDSMNLFPFGLAKFNKEKIDYSKFTKTERHKHMEEIKSYLVSDLKNLWNLLKPFIDEYGAKITLASTAYSIWRNESGLKAESDIEHDKKFRKYYFGGRVEAVRPGYYKQPIYSYDINSAYPYAMIHDHPWGIIPFESKKLPDLKEEIQRSFINLACKSNGSLPYRTKKGLFFPDDGKEREFYVTGWEFLDSGIEKKCEIFKVLQLADKINFKPYVKRFYDGKAEAKAKGDKNGEIYNKTLLNALYGKFASNFDKYKAQRIIHQENINLYISQGWQPCNEFGKNTYLIERELNESEKYWKNVAVGASITGFVRAFLRNNAKKVWQHLIYMDTDSLKTLKQYPLNIGTKLGQWKYEGEYTEAGILGKKLYAMKYKEPKLSEEGEKIWWSIACKGVNVTAKDLIALVKGEIKRINYKSESPTFSVKRGKFYIEREIKLLDKQQIE